MTAVRGNIVANFLGRSWALLMGVLFVPVYLHFLGVEPYGLIGIFTVLQAMVVVADFGMSITVTREMARASVQAGGADHMPDLVRTFEIVYWCIAVGFGATLIFVAPWVATEWVNSSTLPRRSIEDSIRLMGVTICLQMPYLLYQAGLNGLQRQALVNGIAGVAATLRWGGAAVVLWAGAPTIEAFFVWQALAAAAATAAVAVALWRSIPNRTSLGRFDVSILRRVWRFTLVSFGSAAAGIAMTQADKVILSRLLSLEQFGYYSVAAMAASLLKIFVTPIGTAIYPRFVQMYQAGDSENLSDLYHKAAQLLGALLIPTALLLAMFPAEILWIWIGDEPTVRNATVAAALLSIAALAYALPSIANYMLAVIGRPSVMLYANVVGTIVVVPLLLLTVPRFGLPAAGAVLIVASSIYAATTIIAMHRSVLKEELGRWVFACMLRPIAVAFGVLAIVRFNLPQNESRTMLLFALGIAWIAAAGAVAAASPALRSGIISMRHRR
jgi:O-antigen/teichoic acid export membrane protein